MEENPTAKKLNTVKFDAYLQKTRLDKIIEHYPIAKQLGSFPLTPYSLKNTDIILFDINFNERTLFQTNMIISKMINTIINESDEEQTFDTPNMLPFNMLEYRKTVPLDFIFKYLPKSVNLLEETIQKKYYNIDIDSLMKYFIETLHKINGQQYKRVNLQIVKLFWETNTPSDRTVKLLESKLFDKTPQSLTVKDVKKMTDIPIEWVSRIYE
jgi:hypothetical protein